jgi:hypothetical protein
MNDLPIDMLPEDQEAAELARAERLAAKVDSFGVALCGKRKEAIDGRKASGIEDEWEQAENAYQGIDAATGGSANGKPSSASGGYINGPAKAAGRSTVFLNITRSYVDAAAAKVGDMLLPSDDSPWGIRPTPLPSDMGSLGQQLPGVVPMLEQPGPGMPFQPPGMEMQGAPGMEMPQPMDPAQAAVGLGQQPHPPQMPGMPPMGGPMGMPVGAPMGPPPKNPIQQAIDELHERSKKAAEGAQKQIEDWFIECYWHAEVRKMIEDCARLGTGVLKGPFPVKRVSRMTTAENGEMVKVIEERIAPASKCISPWKFYPDPAAGESIQEGSYVWEVDTITAKGLRDLKGVPGYIESQIDKVLEEGPGGKHKTDLFIPGNVKAKDDDQFEIWYFYGFAEREDLEAAGVEVPGDGPVTVPAIVTMVNDCVIKAALNPLDTGEFPYDLMVWQRKTGVPWGMGVAMQINTPQRMLNAATRNMMDNAGFSAGPQIVLRRDAISPADGTWAMTPRKFWFVNDGADVNAVNQAFMAVNIPTMQGELMNIIQFALKMAEDVTGLPMLMQGQQGQSPDTVGGMQMLLNNASVVLRRVARLFDDRVIEPHVRRYYNWLMEYGDDDSIKGDFQIDARGSTALVERDIQQQALLQMGAMVMNPAFGIDPEKWIQEAMKAQRLDPKRLLMDEEKKAMMAQQAPPPPPQIEVAKIRAEADMQKAQMQAELQQMLAQMKAQTDMQIAQMREQIGLQKIQADVDRDTTYVTAETRRTQVEYEARMQELMVKRDLEMLKYANANQTTLEKIKADLAKEAMKINSVKELAGMKASADMMPTPPIEPPGRAPVGESFQK